VKTANAYQPKSARLGVAGAGTNSQRTQSTCPKAQHSAPASRSVQATRADGCARRRAAAIAITNATPSVSQAALTVQPCARPVKKYATTVADDPSAHNVATKTVTQRAERDASSKPIRGASADRAHPASAGAL
jgi:hypothetical protein